MQIQRYIPRGMKTSYFGEHDCEKGNGFRWLFGDGRIGLISDLSYSAGRFIQGILNVEVGITINPYKESLQIQRNNTIHGVVKGESPQLCKLVEFIMRNELHLFSTFNSRDKVPRVLTFSLSPPSKRCYVLGKPLEVNFVNPQKVNGKNIPEDLNPDLDQSELIDEFFRS